MKAAEINALLQSRVPEGMALELPPRCFVDMEGEFLAYDPEQQWIQVRFPIMERYQNPLGYVQGGFLTAMIDNSIGPLSFLVAPPNVTTQLTMTFIRPVTPAIPFVTVEGWVKEQTRRQLFLEGHILTPEGKKAALAVASCMVLG